MRRAHIVGLVAAGLLIVALSNIHRVYAVFWKAEGATVIPTGCKAADCELHGTLRVDPWTGDYRLEQADGFVITLTRDGFSMIRYPVPARAGSH